MSTLHSYVFNNMSGLRSDMVDQTQVNVQNTKFGSYSVSNYFSDSASNSQVQFATQHHGIMFGNGVGGISASVVDYESALLNKVGSERPLEKLQLHQRPFITVPYLGRGCGDPTLESQLQQGENISDKKSVSTIMDKPYCDPQKYPLRDDLKSYINNPSNSIEELAFDGWRRGGVSAREMTMEQKNEFRPNTSF